MKTKFYVGQKVWDDILETGNLGVVERINIESIFPVVVLFGINYTRTYTNDGRSWSQVKPTLSAVPYKFELPPQPEVFEKYERVLMRDSIGKQWSPEIFMEFDQNDPVYPYKTYGSCFSKCRKWDESLIGKVTE